MCAFPKAGVQYFNLEPGGAVEIQGPGQGQHQVRRIRAPQRFLPTKPFPQFANSAPTDRQNPIDRRIQPELPTAIVGWANLTDFSQIDGPTAVDLEESVILEMRQKHRELTHVGQTLGAAGSDKGIALFGLKEENLIGFHRYTAPVGEMEKHAVVESFHVTIVGSFRGER